MNLKFSIIIPVYNAELYLSEALNSIFNQIYKNFEIICINDGSTDQSSDLLNDYASKHENLTLINKSNKGASNARNLGIKISSGDYILFLDSDDYYLSNNFLYEFNRILTNDNTIECIYFPGGFINDKNFDYQTFDHKTYSKGINCINDYCRNKSLLVFGSIYTQCFKRSVIMENDLMFEETLVYGEDRLFTIKYFILAQKVYVYPSSVYCYRIRQNSLMTNPNIKKQIFDTDILCHQLFFLFLSTRFYYRNIMTYINGLYVQNIISSYKNDISSIKLNKKLLFNSSRTIKRKIKSLILLVSCKLYIQLFD